MDWLTWVGIALASWLSVSIVGGLLIGSVLGRARQRERRAPTTFSGHGGRRAA